MTRKEARGRSFMSVLGAFLGTTQTKESKMTTYISQAKFDKTFPNVAAPSTSHLMLSDEKIMEIAKPHIRSVGDYGCCEDAIPDSGAIEDFARALAAYINGATPSTSMPFGWTKQSEIESSRKYGGSFNVWLQKHDCDTPLFATSVAAPSTSEEVSKLKDLLGEVSAHFTRDDDLPNDLLPRIDAAIKGGA